MDQNRTWLITGATGGIGKCMVYYLIGLKEKVIAIDQNHEKLNDMKDLLRNELFLPYPCDLSIQSQIDEVIEDLKTKKLSIDVIVNNAVAHHESMMTSSYDDMMHGLKVNVIAPMYLTKLLVPLLNKNASIIHMLSTRANQSEKDSEIYAASKGALASLTHAMMMSLKGIARVNAIQPGWIDTTSCEKRQDSFEKSDHMQHPSERIGAPMDIIQALLFLADNKQSFINGETITIDGGMSKMMIYHNEKGWIYNPK